MTSSQFINSVDSSKYFSNLEETDLKRAIKKLKDDRKRINKGNKRNFFTPKEYIDSDVIYDFLMDQNRYTDMRIEEEKKKSKENLYNEELARKAGWYNKKELKDISPLLKWADECYPNLNVELFECEFELELIQKYLQQKN